MKSLASAPLTRRSVPLALATVLVAMAAPVAGQEVAAVFEIGEDTYTFDRVLCSLPQNAGGELAITASQDRLTLDLTANRTIGPVVSLYDRENPMSPSVSWEAPAPTITPSQRRSLDLIEVDGSLVTVEAPFTNEHTGATAEGRVVVDCS